MFGQLAFEYRLIIDAYPLISICSLTATSLPVIKKRRSKNHHGVLEVE
jgi:hypothetical protein